HNEPQGVVYSRLDPGSYKALVHYFGEEEVLFVQSSLLNVFVNLLGSFAMTALAFWLFSASTAH
ncbi:hypothetical protein, partial [Escherichia coli]|uniref:hypothetical protein n=1 Tax=Escherichia coli TaxID=562 RepID=UPI003EDFC1C7